MDDPLEVGSWKDLFVRHNVSDVRKVFKTLDARKSDHGEKVRQLVGAKHAQLVELAERISNVKYDALSNERELAHLCSSKHDAAWESYLQNLDNYNSRLNPVFAKTTSRQLASRLLGFASDCLLAKRYLASARAIYFVSELCSDAEIRQQASRQRDTLTAVVGDWLDNGINDGMSQELFNTCLVTNSITPKRMVVDFLQRRKEHVAADLQRHTQQDLLHTMDLIASTLYVANQLTDHLFKAKLPRSRLLNSPEFSDADLRIEDLSYGIDEAIFDLPAFPSACYQPDVSIDINAARADFLKDITALLKTSAGPIVSKLAIADVSHLYANLTLKCRDSSELSELGNVVVDAFHDELVTQFEKDALNKLAGLGELRVGLPAKSSEPLKLEFTKSINVLLENLTKSVSGRVGVAEAPLKLIQDWADGCAQVEAEIRTLQQAGGLSRDEDHRALLEAFTKYMTKKAEDARSRSYEAAVSQMDRQLSAATSGTDLALLFTLKQNLDAKCSKFGLPLDTSLNAKLDERLAQALVDGWEIQGEDAELEGLAVPSSVLNSVFQLAVSMDAVLPGFQWPESTLSVLRPLIVAKVQSFHEPAAEEVEEMLSGTGTLAARFQCILGPLVQPNTRERS